MRIRWRGLELPSRLVPTRETATSTYGEFTAEPFERGFGATIGNSLRRILLSSLEGSAVTRVKIQGVQHEFTTIPGVVEDVTDICLNLKSLVVKNTSASPKVIRLDVRNSASDIAAYFSAFRFGHSNTPHKHKRWLMSTVPLVPLVLDTLLAGNCFLGTFARPGIRPSSLSANGKTAPMPQSTVRADIAQARDILLDFPS